MMATQTAQKIMDIAERRARTSGYDGFSFREIASELGIKPASVHYHFPTKADLGAAITQRYADRFLEDLGDPEDPNRSADQLLDRFVDAYRKSVATEDLMCLCGMLGAEIAKLPDPVALNVRKFFERNVAWIATVFRRKGIDNPEASARRAVATLEGGLILARATGQLSAFDDAASGIGT